MNRLVEYGGKIIMTDGVRTVELRDPNDDGDHRYQYRRTDDGRLERRVLTSAGRPMTDGSPWERLSDAEICGLLSRRGEYHPILDPLGFAGI